MPRFFFLSHPAAIFGALRWELHHAASFGVSQLSILRAGGLEGSPACHMALV